jgi:hypothetical protein
MLLPLLLLLVKEMSIVKGEAATRGSVDNNSTHCVSEEP